MQNRIPPRSPSLPPSGDPPFTESELAAAEQLIQLSESTGGGAASAFSTGSASSSTRSINAPQPAEPAEDDEGLWRRKKRYRLISDVYASTAQIGGGKSKEINRKRK